MNRPIKVLVTILGIMLLGCSAPSSSQPNQTTTEQLPSPSPVSSTPNQGQKLPFSATAVIAGKTIKLEVAQTQEQQAIGLMYRTSLPDDQGMLFNFNPPQPVAFWMKNTLIPLDMVFLRNGVVQAIAINALPCKSDPCPNYPSSKTIDQVIELRGGLAAELGLKAGDRVTIRAIRN
ncbi:protein of unknown function DUF192 [Crinalium epipsammum PCC 9333]|uniref:DUF192 domain-containing protein n=1 Tax=Crinalium epipsammum PCC 9333 TaxID=1173022 RepID=K9W036_9CYAN|nr:DUF192 domain-containing protein [Crinalium epipsammum]AFZ13566.1 protein of unknown function DUF192 [Crinalium epipsammum PCC 9333]